MHCLDQGGYIRTTHTTNPLTKFLADDEESEEDPEEDPEEDDYDASDREIDDESEEEKESDNHITIATIKNNLVDAQARLTDVERGIAGLQERADATNTLALLPEGRSVKAIQDIDHQGM